MTSYVNFAGAPINLGGSPSLAAVSASSIGQVLDGTSANDLLGDIAGGATLVGGAGDDSYVVTDSRTQIIEQPGGGIDTVTAYNNYVMPANVEIMKLGNVGITGVANNAGDTMFVTGSHDTLDAGTGSDVLVDSGTGGANIFSFVAGDGDDVVYGFKAGDAATHDTLRLADYGITSFSQLDGKISQVGADTLITLSSTDAILLKGVTAGSLTANDFMLQIDTSHLTPTFDDEFNGLSLYNAGTGQGVWKTNYFFGAQSGPWAYNSREMNAQDQSLAVDPSFSGTGTTPLGIDPFSISNGVLSINTEKTPSADVTALSGYDYTTGVLTTEKSFAQTYGYFEIKTELPSQQGMWPAFWLLPQNGGNPPELDVMEYMGGDQTLQTVHTSANGGSETGFSTYSPGATTGFHTYGVLWTPTTITWYMDGVAIHTTATPADMDQPMYMVVSGGLSTEVNGGAAANFNGASMLVDYVHAYSLADVEAAGGVSGVTGGGTSSTGESSTSTSTGGDTSPPPTSGGTDTSGTGAGGSSTPTGGDTSTPPPSGGTGTSGTGGGSSSTSTSGGASTSTSTGGDTSTSPPSPVGSASSSSDSTNATTGADTVHNANGNDTVHGAQGADAISLSAGNDSVNGGVGNDSIAAGNGNDSIFGGKGDDLITSGGDSAHGDSISGDVGNDNITGGAGADTIFGNVDNDTVNASGGADSVNGNAGDDSLASGAGSSTMYGGQGSDTLHSGSDATHHDWLSGDIGSDVIVGGAGADTLLGGQDADVITGNSNVTTNGGGDSINGGADNDTITVAGNGLDTVFGGQGNDAIYVTGSGADSISGDMGNDTITVTGSGHDTITGGAGHDEFIFGTASSGVSTVAGAIDQINAFAAGDTIHFIGDVAGSSTNYKELANHTTYASALTDATAAMTAGGVHYVAVEVDTSAGHDTYLFHDGTHATGASSDAIKLVGLSIGQISDTSIV